MVEIMMEKVHEALHPTDEDSMAAMRRVPEGTLMNVKFSVPRNPRTHRLFFALIKLLWTHQKEPRRFPTPEKLRAALLMGIGHTLEIVDLEGIVHIIPDSIAFGRLDDIAFSQLLESAIHCINTRILPGMDSPTLEREVSEMLRLPHPDQYR